MLSRTLTKSPTSFARFVYARFVYAILLAGVVLVAATGCREVESLPPLYNYDLGDGTTRLLPNAGIIHQAHDPSIVSGGSTRADIYHAGDPFEEPPVPITGSTAPLPPATNAAEALSNVGQAWIGNLLSGGGAPSVSTNGASTSAGDENAGDAGGGD